MIPYEQQRRVVEAELQKIISKMYRKAGWIVTKLDPGAGIEKGLPDLVMFGPNGQVVFIEVKTRAGRLSPIQEHQIERLKKMGHDVRVIRGTAQAEEILRGQQ